MEHMAPFRLYCASCDIVRVSPDRVTVTVDAIDTTLRFTCPSCRTVQTTDIQRWAVDVFVDAGVQVIDTAPPPFGQHPAFGLGPITEEEIDRFVADLGRADWIQTLS